MRPWRVPRWNTKMHASCLTFIASPLYLCFPCLEKPRGLEDCTAGEDARPGDRPPAFRWTKRAVSKIGQELEAIGQEMGLSGSLVRSWPNQANIDGSITEPFEALGRYRLSQRRDLMVYRQGARALIDSVALCDSSTIRARVTFQCAGVGRRHGEEPVGPCRSRLDEEPGRSLAPARGPTNARAVQWMRAAVDRIQIHVLPPVSAVLGDGDPVLVRGIRAPLQGHVQRKAHRRRQRKKTALGAFLERYYARYCRTTTAAIRSIPRRGRHTSSPARAGLSPCCRWGCGAPRGPRKRCSSRGLRRPRRPPRSAKKA